MLMAALFKAHSPVSHIRSYICVSIHIRMHIHIRIYVCVCIYTHIYTYMYIHTLSLLFNRLTSLTDITCFKLSKYTYATQISRLSSKGIQIRLRVQSSTTSPEKKWYHLLSRKYRKHCRLEWVQNQTVKIPTHVRAHSILQLPQKSFMSISIFSN